MAAVASVNTALLGARRNIANARATQSASSARPVLARSARGLTVRAADGASPRRSFTRRRPSSAMAKKAPPGHVGGSVRLRAAIHPSSTFADARSPPVSYAGEGEEAPAEPEVRRDPIFGFESRGEPDKIQPGFDTAEGGKVGPVGTFFISLLLIVLFGASFFFTSVPRDAIKGMVDLSDDPNAPTDVFK